MSGVLNLERTYQFLLIALAFLIPLTVFGANLIVVLICLIWIISGNYRTKIQMIMSNKLMIASVLFFSLHVIGLLWTEDLNWGFHIVHKMWYFIGLFPILFTVVKKEYIDYYLNAFLLSILITEIFSFLIWFQVIEPFGNASLYNPTPFMTHISFNPILAFAIYIVSHKVLFDESPIYTKLFLSFFTLAMSINMFITGGRAGQVMFFAVLAILIFQFFSKQKFKAIFVVILFTTSVFFGAYNTSNIFHKRVNDVVSNIQVYESNKKTSVGIRIAYALNSWEVILKNPIIGVGTGDFPKEYKLVNQKNTPQLPNATNPHNMYILIFMQLGLIGLISFLMIFYYQIKLSFASTNKLIKDIGVSLPILFLIIMFSDSYLLGHFTSLMFVFFSSFLYKDFEKYN